MVFEVIVIALVAYVGFRMLKREYVRAKSDTADLIAKPTLLNIGAAIYNILFGIIIVVLAYNGASLAVTVSLAVGWLLSCWVLVRLGFWPPKPQMPKE